jgi:protein tyrosine phosphatase (PTP) superfamily phosphohydrolase (DUF442 family)
MSSLSRAIAKRLGQCLRWIFLPLVVLLLAYVLYLAVTHNLHVVSPGRIYRSAQLSPGALANAIQRDGIKSVLNLRGGTTNDAWYRGEISTTLQLGAQHFDFPLSAGRELTGAQMDELLALIDRAPKPMLIHCKSGSDRTGLLSALYLYHGEGRPADAAVRQLTMLYGHFPYLFWRDTIAMDRSFWRYVSNHVTAAKPDRVLPVPDSTNSLARRPGQ